MNYELLAIPIAYLLDLILGDPQWYWHPVRIIGRLIEFLELRLNTGKINGINRKFSGFIMVILVVGLTVTFVWMILYLAKSIHPFFYFLFLILSIYFVISVRSLALEADKVREVLDKNNIQEARRCLSMIVGRDTDNLDPPEIIRATIETVAESIMDGIVAPLFYLFLGGPVLAWGYKAINTLDSMVGYRSSRFINFGWASAKIDGLANLIASRLTMLFTLVSSFWLGNDWRGSIKWSLKYLFRSPRYNSEATEATMAGALGIQLGGLNFYNSIPLQNPLIGDNLYPKEPRHIKESIKIAYLASVFCLVLGLILTSIMRKGVKIYV